MFSTIRQHNNRSHWLQFSLLLLIIFLTIRTLLNKLENHDRFQIRWRKYGVIGRQSILTVRCIVNIDYCEGRLGNAMFLVASAYGLARLHSCHINISTQILEKVNKTFSLKFSPATLLSTDYNVSTHHNSDVSISITKSAVCEYFRELSRPNAIPYGTALKLTGYWQSYLHFAKYDDELRTNVFAGTKDVLQNALNFFNQIYQQKFNSTIHFSTDEHKILKKQLMDLDKTTWIGVHVRRSDFLLIKFSSSDTYLFTAMDYFNDQYPDAQFIIASDDKLYCQQLFRNRSNVFITPFSFSTGEDLITLSMCEHSIVTGGSFGWWSAYLANGHVVHDRIYRSGCVRHEQYYPPWFMISDNS